MRSLLRCFGAERELRPWQDAPSHASASNATAQRSSGAVVQGPVALPPRASQPTAACEVAAKVQHLEVAEAEQNVHRENDGVVQVMADDEGDRQALALSASVDFPQRISFGSPQLLNNTTSYAAHHSLTLKLQGAARPASTCPFNAVGSDADAPNTVDSTERTTACSNFSSQCYFGSKADASSAAAAIATAGSSSIARATVATPSLQPQPQPQPNPQGPSRQLKSPPVASDSAPTLHLIAGDVMTSPVVGTLLETPRTSPSRCSAAQATHTGGVPRRHGAAGGGCGGGAGDWSAPLPVPRALSAEELSALVTSLSQVRGHWLEVLHTVVTLAAELLGADSLSIHLLSDSGGTHAALACQGDAGGAIRLGMPLPALPPQGQQLTALQRLYLTGEPQRGSVWTLPQHAQHVQQQQQAGSSASLPQLAAQAQGGAPQVAPQNAGGQQPLVAVAPPALPPDWQAMRVLGGMTDFVAVPLMRGAAVFGALQVVDNCTPPEDNTGAMPMSRRCRVTAELSVVAAFIGTLLVDHEVLCVMGALEAVAAAQDVDGLVRGLARHVGLFCRMRKYITPGVRVALIRGDAAALALFLDEGAPAAAAAAAAAGNPSHGVAGVAGGSVTPVGVLSAAVSRHSTACNLQAMSTACGGGWPTFSTGGGVASGGCTADARLVASSSASASITANGLGTRRSASGLATVSRIAPAKDATGSTGSDAQCLLPMFTPPPSSASRARLPCTVLDVELSAKGPAAAAARAGPPVPRAIGAHPLVVAPVVAGGGDEDGTGALVPMREKASSVCFGPDPAVAIAMSTVADFWPWYASTVGSGVGGCPAVLPRAGSPTLNLMASVVSDESVLVPGGRELNMADDDVESRASSMAAANAAAMYRNVAAAMAAAAAQEPSAAAAAADSTSVSPAPASMDAGTAALRRRATVDIETAAAAAAAAVAAATSSPASVSALVPMGGLPSSPQHAPSPSAALGPSRGTTSGGLYGRALAMAGEDSTAPGGRGIGQVQGHAMLTRGTVLAEALAVGTGMYISDVAIYMQDGRNKSRDVFVAPSGRGGPAQPTNSIAVTTVSYAGVPLVGLYITFGMPLPASLLNAVISKVHLFGEMLGPLLHDRLTSGDSNLADEWRYLLGEVLDPQAIQSAADDQRSRRSSASLYNQQQQKEHQQQQQLLLQQQHQQQHQPHRVALVAPPLTGPRSPLQILTGVATTPVSRNVSPGGGSSRSPNALVASAAAAASAATRNNQYDSRYDSCGSSGRRRQGYDAAVNYGTSSLAGAVPALRRSQTADGPGLGFGSIAGRASPGAYCSGHGSVALAVGLNSNDSGGFGSSVSATATVAATAVAAGAGPPHHSTGLLNRHPAVPAVPALPFAPARNSLVSPPPASPQSPQRPWPLALEPHGQPRWQASELAAAASFLASRPHQAGGRPPMRPYQTGHQQHQRMPLPTSLGSPPRQRPPAGQRQVSPPSISRLEKSVSAGVASGTRRRAPVLGVASDGAGCKPNNQPATDQEQLAIQLGSTTLSSETGIASCSTSGALGPVIAAALALTQTGSGTSGALPLLTRTRTHCETAVMGELSAEAAPRAEVATGSGSSGLGQVPGLSSSPLSPNPTLVLGLSSAGGGGGADGELLVLRGGSSGGCKELTLSADTPSSDINLKIVPCALPVSERHVRLQDEQKERQHPWSAPRPLLPGAASAGATALGSGALLLPQQQQPAPPPPAAPPAPSGAIAASSAGTESLVLRGAGFYPDAAAVASRSLHRSPSLASNSSAMPLEALGTSQPELLPHMGMLPSCGMTLGSVGGSGFGGGSRAGQVGNSSSSSSHNMDVELSMQAWHLPTDPFRMSSSRGSRHVPGGNCGVNTLASGPAAVDAPCAGRPAHTRQHPPSPSPLSPARSGSAPSVRRRSAGGTTPVSRPPQQQQQRGTVGLSRLTTVGTAGVAPMGGATSAAGAGAGYIPSPGDALMVPPSDPGPHFVRSASTMAFGSMHGTLPLGQTGGPGAGPQPSLHSPIVQRLRSSVRRNTSFNITADPGVQDTGKVAPVMANLQDKLRSLQAEQVLARLHNKESSGADELSGLTILEPLGSGGFGTVFRGIFNGIEAAVKVLCERGAGGRSEAATMREAFELAVMTTISHPHIVQVLTAFTDVILSTQADPAGGAHCNVVLPRSPATEELGEPTVVIAMEYCDGGSLADAVTAGRFRQRVPGGYGATQPYMPAIYATLLEIALALRHMHAMLLVHCDLKPANILLKSNMRDPRGFSAKLSDFGLVKMMVEDGSGGTGGVIGRDARTGTVTHMAPELIRATEASKMDTSVDIYAFGVLMWEMLSTAPVYLGIRSEEIRRGVVAGGLRPEFPPWSDEKYRTLANSCLSTDPRARPSSAELVARLRSLLAESGALQDTIQRRPVRSSAYSAADHPGGGGNIGFPGSHTAAAAGAMLGIEPADFSRLSRLQPPQPVPQQGMDQQQQHSRRRRSRSCSGYDSSSFPLHIL